MQLPNEVVAFLVQSLGCSWNIALWIVLGISLLDLIPSFWPCVPCRRSISCVHSNVTFVSEIVSFTTGFTGWVDRSRISFFCLFVLIALLLLRIFLWELEFVWPLLVMLLFLPALFVLSWAWSFSRWSWWHWFLWWPGLLQWWQVGLCFSGFWDFVGWLFVSHYLYAANLELPNHLMATPFQDVTQFVHMCDSPNEPDQSFSPGGEAFCHIKIAQYSPDRQLQMHLSLASGIGLENQLTGVPCFFYGSQSEFLPISFCWGLWCFWIFVAHHHARENGSSWFVFSCVLTVNFQPCLEQIFKQF